MEKNYSRETIMAAWNEMRQNRKEFEAGRRVAATVEEKEILGGIVSGYNDCIKILEHAVAVAGLDK